MKNLIFLRGKRGFTQQRLSEETNLSRSAIIKLESGKLKIGSEKNVDKICNVLECNPIELYTIDEIVNVKIVDDYTRKYIIKLLEELDVDKR